MRTSRRTFLRGAAASAVGWPIALYGQAGDRLFQHGVASGDPLGDRVVLWTRVTPPPARSAVGPIDAAWLVADDESLTRVVARGRSAAAPERDFTVKVDAAGLRAGRTYFYAFEAGGQRSPVGRTRTFGDAGIDRLRLGVVSCSNYAAGYFNAYRGIAARDDLDAVLHLGDYIYESAEGVFGDGSAIGRAPLPLGEAATLAAYRLRYAVYRSDPDLQEAHRRHPFIVVWDDHEIADNAWADGANGVPRANWARRLAAAYRAYVEWLPVREMAGSDIRLYRRFKAGNLVDLMMLDTRGLRDRQITRATADQLASPARSILGAAQEAWLFDGLRESMQMGTRWRVLGQQVLFSPISPIGPPLSVDMWDGYPAARARVMEFLARERIADLVLLTGDVHSSWGIEVAQNPWAPAGSDAARPLGVELVTPAISSPPLFTDATLRQRAPLLRQFAPHVKFLDGDGNGYILLDVTADRVLAEWYFVPTVRERTADDRKAAAFVCARGSSRLSPA
jgi:alkaline phosphatase D